MDHDLALVIGLVVAVFSIPSIVSSFSERRPPRVAALAVLVGLGLVVWSVTQKPGGYKINEIPGIMIDVVGRYVN